MGDATMRAVVLLSGGMDSATCLAMARRDGCECHALSFDYGQRHRAELEAAARACPAARRRAPHRTLTIGLGDFGGSALTDRAARGAHPDERRRRGIPITYVPARNTVFLAFALASRRCWMPTGSTPA